MQTDTVLSHLELDKIPKPGDTIALPAGLKYMNEYYASRHVTRSPRTVRVRAVERDEVFWKEDGETPAGETCYARWRRNRT
jgi:hypothetical protein